jgi:hypothetical protein
MPYREVHQPPYRLLERSLFRGRERQGDLWAIDLSRDQRAPEKAFEKGVAEMPQVGFVYIVRM